MNARVRARWRLLERQLRTATQITWLCASQLDVGHSLAASLAGPPLARPAKLGPHATHYCTAGTAHLINSPPIHVPTLECLRPGGVAVSSWLRLLRGPGAHRSSSGIERVSWPATRPDRLGARRPRPARVNVISLLSSTHATLMRRTPDVLL
jgi:hypothetical protein